MEEGKSTKHWQVPTYLTKIVGSSFVVIAMALLAVVGVSGVFGYQLLKNQNEFKTTQEMMLSNLRVINEQTVIREVVEDKIGGKLSSDQKARIAFEIYDGCRRNGIKAELVLGLIEQESGWNASAVSSAGAIGLMQCMPDTAVRYFKMRGLTFSIEALRDPILNVTIGIEILVDKHEAAMAQGKTTKDNFTYALYYYCGKGDTYAREVISRSVSYKKRLDTPLQEMLRKLETPEPIKEEKKKK